VLRASTRPWDNAPISFYTGTGRMQARLGSIECGCKLALFRTRASRWMIYWSPRYPPLNLICRHSPGRLKTRVAWAEQDWMGAREYLQQAVVDCGEV